VGGALAQRLDNELLTSLRAKLHEFCAPPRFNNISFNMAHCGTDGPVLGAIVLTLRSIDRQNLAEPQI
jgi:hypothetical protein